MQTIFYIFCFVRRCGIRRSPFCHSLRRSAFAVLDFRRFDYTPRDQNMAYFRSVTSCKLMGKMSVLKSFTFTNRVLKALSHEWRCYTIDMTPTSALNSA